MLSVTDPNTLSATDVLASVGNTSVSPPFAQRAGFVLAIAVGIMIALVVAMLLAFIFFTHPQPPIPGTVATSEEQSARAIEAYRILSELSINNALELFKTIVGQALLPVFTALLGYIFAKESNGSS